ncbi:hypothetical protein HK101_001575 [Irineochytrium annulatum]|nr:hypothetical protein HK101_001575 [Irineochytrium annulatum]
MPHQGVVSLPASQLDGTGLRILIVHTRWNSPIVDSLTNKAVETLKSLKVPADKITIQSVPGSYELPIAVQSLLKYAHPKYDAAIAIGVLIKGETMHFEYIADATTQGLMRVGLDESVPVIFGVLTCLTEEQALSRSGLKEGGHNHAIDWAQAAVEMAILSKRGQNPEGYTTVYM